MTMRDIFYFDWVPVAVWVGVVTVVLVVGFMAWWGLR